MISTLNGTDITLVVLAVSALVGGVTLVIGVMTPGQSGTNLQAAGWVLALAALAVLALVIIVQALIPDPVAVKVPSALPI